MDYIGLKKIEDIRELQNVELNILKYFDSVCRENGIDYSLIGGSLIGAVRHKGFIPWDDDVDVVLTRDNYRKVEKILKQNAGRYRVSSSFPEKPSAPVLKLFDTQTCGYAENTELKMDNFGVYIDVFCYCPTFNNEKLRRLHYSYNYFVYILHRKPSVSSAKSTLHKIARICKNTVYEMMSKNFLSRMSSITFMGRDKKNKYVLSNFNAYPIDKEVQLKEDTLDYIDIQFEDLKAMSFKNYERILTTTYGDYMKLPPEEDRKPKHSYYTYFWREL